MKVVLVNTSESKGGAAVACKRLYTNYKENNVDCKLIVFNKTSTDENVIQIPVSKIKHLFISFLFYLELIIQKLLKKKHVDFSFSFFGIDLSKIKEIQEADIIHLHWINNSFIQIKGLQKLINSNKKIVWTMHDMWTFTGGCHYSDTCELYKNTCTNCPKLKNNSFDFAKLQQSKKESIELNHIKYITPSNWLKSIGNGSRLLKNSNIVAIPNCIDTNIFKRIEKKEALLNLQLAINPDEKVLLYVAMNANDPRKGYTELIKSLNHWLTISNETINLIIIGRLKELPDLNTNRIKIHALGRLFDVQKIVSAYSCADVFLMPSQQDNLPNTIMESLACGTPIVAYSIGGIPEMIDHQQTGYLVSPGNIEGFSDGIQWILQNTPNMHNQCLLFATKNYSNEVVFKKHMEVYKTI